MNSESHGMSHNLQLHLDDSDNCNCQEHNDTILSNSYRTTEFQKSETILYR